MSTQNSPLDARRTLESASGPVTYYSLPRLQETGVARLDSLPFSIRILLENVLRNQDGLLVTEDDLQTAAQWSPQGPPTREIPFMPTRVILQDFTGVPAVVDLAALRSAVYRAGGDPKRINPIVPADLVIDHSVQVDHFGTQYSFMLNVEKEYERNRERYALLRWAQSAFQNFRVIPPGNGIVHQINLEYLASVVATRTTDGERVAFPDTLIGTDSHTTMVNGLSVLGWGVGGIEAEAVLLGQPYYMLMPEVVGVKLTGALKEGTTATDLVLAITEILRKKGVVEKFVEFYGRGLSNLPLADRATIANMSPEYGATVGLFPTDQETLRYLRNTGRDPAQVDLVERYAKAQSLFRTDDTPDPQYSDTLTLDMSTVEPALAGPKRPQDRVLLAQVKQNFLDAFGEQIAAETPGPNGESLERWNDEGGHSAEASARTSPARSTAVVVDLDGEEVQLAHGSVVIAAITSCTNTSNPSVMVGAGLLAKNAVERGLTSKPWVKTSMAPGSRVVTDYLDGSGLTPFLETLGFHTVGYGCTTCIGNSGPLPDAIAQAVTDHNLVAAAVLSGNRNFEGRIHAQVKANYLASPMLVVAYALAGRMDIDLEHDPLGHDANGQPVHLRDIWPSQEQISTTVTQSLVPEMFTSRYSEVFDGDEKWRNLPVPQGDLYAWDTDSTYVQEPPFFQDLPPEPPPLEDILGARVLVLLGDSVTTDHISPAGAIPAATPAGQLLMDHGVERSEFNTYGARRGNHDVMVRGTFGNIRLRNGLTPDREGDWTLHIPSNKEMRIYDASAQYIDEGVPLVVITGKEYGAGSSRDWAAKGPHLLGVRAVISESYERIHRSNLVGMGILPLQFKPGENAATLGLTGRETYDFEGIAQGLTPGQEFLVRARSDAGAETLFTTIVRIDTPVEVEYYRNGGVLQTVLRRILTESAGG
ncbi:MAG: aconitate hydratase AcnA [Chloroflexi bacterium]|nr:aconitate hydratase AcnA [Chloroflexota bacterium]